MAADDDPVLVKRAKIARLTRIGRRTGYLCFALAIVLFVVGFVRGFDETTTALIWGLLVGGSALLAPAIVFGYAVKAAEREDREAGHL